MSRKSIRKFSDQPVTDEQIDTLLRAMIAAPSAGNMQPWRIFVVRDPEIKRHLAFGARNQHFIARAPVVFVICRVPAESGAGYGSRGQNLYSIQDTAAMTQNLLVGAHALGLGGCWVGAFYEDRIAKAVNCQKGVIPVAVVPIGYPRETRRKSGRRSMREVVTFLPENRSS